MSKKVCPRLRELKAGTRNLGHTNVATFVSGRIPLLDLRPLFSLSSVCCLPDEEGPAALGPSIQFLGKCRLKGGDPSGFELFVQDKFNFRFKSR